MRVSIVELRSEVNCAGPYQLSGNEVKGRARGGPARDVGFGWG
jgi:hypothetical protein